MKFGGMFLMKQYFLLKVRNYNKDLLNFNPKERMNFVQIFQCPWFYMWN